MITPSGAAKFGIGYAVFQFHKLTDIIIKGVYEKNNGDIFYCPVLIG
ncbi:MAG: hypothetical protein ACUVQT_03965 [bacterium]